MLARHYSFMLSFWLVVVSLTMTRKPKDNVRTAAKSFPLDIVDHGEKMQGSAVHAEHHFYGTSPLLYVSAASTQRPVYMCLHAEYKDRQRQAVTDFDQDLFRYKRQVEECHCSRTAQD